MNAFFFDSDVERLPPDEVRILDLGIEPYADRQRMKVRLNLPPFQQPPYIDLTLLAPDGSLAATTSIVEPANWNLELTLHLRTESPLPGIYTLTAVLAYPDLGEIDRRSASVEILSAGT